MKSATEMFLFLAYENILGNLCSNSFPFQTCDQNLTVDTFPIEQLAMPLKLSWSFTRSFHQKDPLSFSNCGNSPLE
jgi:hypothetical protein